MNDGRERLAGRDRAATLAALLALAAATAVSCAQVLGVDDWTDSSGETSAGVGSGGAPQGPTSSGSATGDQGTGAAGASSSDGPGPTSTAGSTGGAAASSAESTVASSTSAASTAASSTSASTGNFCDPTACQMIYPDDGCQKGACDAASNCVNTLYNEGGFCALFGGFGTCSNGVCMCSSSTDCSQLGCSDSSLQCCVGGTCVCQPEGGPACP